MIFPMYMYGQSTNCLVASIITVFSIDLKTLLSILSEIPKNMAISIDRECINSIVSLVFVYAVFL